MIAVRKWLGHGLLAVCVLLAACSRPSNNSAGSKTAGNVEGEVGTLPAPAGANGSVTGMPDSAPMHTKVTPAVIETTPPDLAPPTDAEPVNDVAVGEPAPAPATEPDAAGAVSVIRDYYAAINAGQHERAWRLWENGGAASGQSLQQFTQGFADTAGVSVEIGEPGRVDAGAGQRFVRVPVNLRATLRDGSTQRFIGEYELHASVVEGAEAGGQWRIRAGHMRAR